MQCLVLVLVELSMIDQAMASQAASNSGASGSSESTSETTVMSHVSGVFSAISVGLVALLAYLALLSYSVLQRRQNTLPPGDKKQFDAPVYINHSTT
ncbi:hypothetical protein PF008_g8086 [Phytophthora fragariae]|uniref:RxLR effector protein n=1 Tax=Phytophthora fragariae TaxID=53985 RepID=A0A6G0S178_9STRA|nr:hypothetical protein PF008_g8086 [Phytophthora fragariae]